VDPAGWRLKLFGTDLYGAPTRDRPIEFGYVMPEGLDPHYVVDGAVSGSARLLQHSGRSAAFRC
jgi:hypothetical protein